MRVRLFYLVSQGNGFASFHFVSFVFQERAAMFVDCYKVLAVLYGHHVAIRWRVGTDDDCPVKHGKDVFIGPCGDIHAIVPRFRVEVGGDASGRWRVQEDAFYGRVFVDGDKVVFFCFFVLFPEFFFTFGGRHERICPQVGQ